MTDPLMPVPPKRYWPVSEKRRIVELTLRKNASVQDVAKQFSLDPPTLSSWRTLYRRGKLVEKSSKNKTFAEALLPVTVTDFPDLLPITTNRMHARIDLPCGASLQIQAETLDFQALGKLLASVRK